MSQINYSAEPVLINFSALNVFFQRAFGLNIFREISREEKYFFDDLLDGVFNGIREEFMSLNSQRIGKKEVSPKEYGEIVVIKKFKVINVE